MGAKSNMRKRLSIITPVFNKVNFTKSYLSDLSKLPDDVEIIIVDNASSDETEAELSKNKRITYIRNNENIGFGRASNIGFQVASAPNVLFLNNDVRVKSNHTNWIDVIIKEARDGCIVGPTMGQLDKDLNFVQEANKVLPGNSYMSGWCLGGLKETFNKLIEGNDRGPFSERYFCYFEDTHMGFLARQLGIPSKVIEVPVVHFGKVSSKQLNTSKLYSEARKIFVEKWGK
jgi:GT2 family glycosyltransferase